MRIREREKVKVGRTALYRIAVIFIEQELYWSIFVLFYWQKTNLKIYDKSEKVLKIHLLINKFTSVTNFTLYGFYKLIHIHLKMYFKEHQPEIKEKVGDKKIKTDI